MTIDGRLLGLRIGSDFVPCEMGLTLNFEVEKRDRSSSANGSWKHHRNGYKGWNAVVNGKLLISSLSGSFNSLFRAYLNDEELSLVIQNRDPNGQPFEIWGNATIKQGTMEAPSVGKATWSITFEGNGALSEDIAVFWKIINAMPAEADKPNIIDTTNW
ncbi:hypothetical protein G5B30_07060 [Sphingobacterium sp. SGG-5]|uniref:hypothetical protein n=1 Tax=Sphingobacterium sp. SGG-5 TaxID=2710881 RepID=UPI0013EB4481|nr:hypothetical protein [Sphingobacterium sp. SGG-5]NGM61675.1 hypothetical protein [Sphingobacterium sp. SGG-5]